MHKHSRAEGKGKGIARKLVNVVENKFLELGIEIFACCIEDWNIESLIFFEKLGYIGYKDIIYYTKRKYPEV